MAAAAGWQRTESQCGKSPCIVLLVRLRLCYTVGVMADDIPQDPQLAATAKLIAEKRDQLLAERTQLREAREALLARSRRVDREIGDCRAAARFFGLNLEFPEDPGELSDRDLHLRRLREHEMATAREAGRLAAQRSLFNEPHHVASLPGVGRPIPPPPPPPVPIPPPPAPPASTLPSAGLGPQPRPTVREVALMRLRAAGDKGAKAADIRDYFERTYGEVVHEKTVGMTLYRLLKANQVRRDGHIWFFGPPSAETKNPGVGAPGQIETGN